MDDETRAALVGRRAPRPIMSAGIVFCAFAVVSLIILITAVSEPRAGGDMMSWVALATMNLSFCIPCVAALVVVIMADLPVPRWARYTMAAISFCVMGFLIVFPFMGIIAVAETDTARALDAFSRDIATRGAWVFALCGLLMGFSLPVTTYARSTKHRDAPRRFRCQLFVGCVLWMSLAYRGVYAIMARSGGVLMLGPEVTFVLQDIAIPATACTVACLVTSIAWGYADLHAPRWVGRLLFWVPLVVLAVMLVSSFVDVAQIHGSMSLGYSEFRISEVAVVYTALLGIVMGVGVSMIDEA